jgi:hypothetical protein
MSITVRAKYDGKALQLSEPIDLPMDSEVEVAVRLVDSDKEPGGDYCFIDTALSLNITGPTDWSTRIDEILYKYPRDADE